jgi:hypothetical protein
MTSFVKGKDPTQPNWKVALPESMVVDTVKWFHQVMGHSDEKRLQQTLKQCYHHPKLCYHIYKLKCKNSKKKNSRPWLWSPIQTRGADCTTGRSCHQFDWTMEGQSQWSASWIHALTWIDKALNLVKLIHIDSKSAGHICDKFTQSWLCLSCTMTS